MDEPFPRLHEPPPEKPRAPWGVKEMVICTVLILVALFLITTAIIGPFLAFYDDDEPEVLVASSVANVLWNLVMVGSVVWFLRRGGGSARDLGLVLPVTEHPVVRTIVLAAATFLAMYLIVVLYGVVIDAFGFDFLEPDQQVSDDFYDSDVALAFLGIAIVLSAPLAEEIFFRGFLFGGTRPITGVLIAAVVTGFVFSLAHYNPGLVLPFTLIGALLAISYQRSGTLFVPIGAHFLFNLVSYCILVFVPEARPE